MARAVGSSTINSLDEAAAECRAGTPTALAKPETTQRACFARLKSAQILPAGSFVERNVVIRAVKTKKDGGNIADHALALQFRRVVRFEESTAWT